MKRIRVMVNGAPGNMAKKIILAALNSDLFEVAPYSLTGPEISEKTLQVKSFDVKLIRPDERCGDFLEIVNNLKPLIAIDFTHPTAVQMNAAFYCAHGVHFVMGTTGGDRGDLVKTVESSGVSAVIAPNMAKQIVGFQAMMEYAAQHFPGLFDGYSLQIRESHQTGKADTSGTARMMVQYFQQLGCDFHEHQIEKIRDRKTQREELGVPDAYLDGHGWHRYDLTSPDQTVRFQFVHNVNGRDVYVLGALDAVRFLHERILHGERGRVFSMIDVMMHK